MKARVLSTSLLGETNQNVRLIRKSIHFSSYVFIYSTPPSVQSPCLDCPHFPLWSPAEVLLMSMFCHPSSGVALQFNHSLQTFTLATKYRNCAIALRVSEHLLVQHKGFDQLASRDNIQRVMDEMADKQTLPRISPKISVPQ